MIAAARGGSVARGALGSGMSSVRILAAVSRISRIRTVARRWHPLGSLALLALLGCGAACNQTGCGAPRCPQGALLVPAGTFEMGTNFDYYNDVERPVHKVTLTKPYCMDRTEVTNSAYWACQKAGKCRMAPREEGTMAKHYPNRPADFVHWRDGVTYCTWRGGRLPTEAEWEFAARGPDGRLYPWGNAEPSEELWQVRPKGTRFTASDVGTHPKGRSAFGLDDMSGNVNEWVHDCWTDYGSQAVTDPRGPEVCPDPVQRVKRGSSWGVASFKQARATLRYGIPPYDSSDQTGFRCAYDPR